MLSSLLQSSTSRLLFSEIQPGVLEGIKKILDDHTMGGTLSETRMKYVLKEF